MKKLALALLLTTPLKADILIPDQKTKRILVLDETKRWNRHDAIKWVYDFKKAKGVASKHKPRFRRLFSRLNEAKRTVFRGRDSILIVGNGGDGVAVIDVEWRSVKWWTKANGDPHTAEILPGDYVAVSHPRRGGVALYKTDRKNNSPIQKTPHGGTHGLHWDPVGKRLYSWGGSNMRVFSFDGERLKRVANYKIPNGYGGGHDLTWLVGSRKLLLTHNHGISKFDMDTKRFEHLAIDRRLRGLKSVSINPQTLEIIYVMPDSTYTGLRNRSHRVRSLTENDRVAAWGGWYKARWFD